MKKTDDLKKEFKWLNAQAKKDEKFTPFNARVPLMKKFTNMTYGESLNVLKLWAVSLTGNERNVL